MDSINSTGLSLHLKTGKSHLQFQKHQGALDLSDSFQILQFLRAEDSLASVSISQELYSLK